VNFHEDNKQGKKNNQLQPEKRVSETSIKNFIPCHIGKRGETKLSSYFSDYQDYFPRQKKQPEERVSKTSKKFLPLVILGKGGKQIPLQLFFRTP